MNGRSTFWVGRNSVLFLLLLALSLPLSSYAQKFTGTNQPGNGTLFGFNVAVGVTNLSLSVSNSLAAFSHLYVKRGDGASVTNYDYVARLDLVNNNVNLELPELTVGTNYSFWVQTPTNSATHPFIVTLTTNRTDARQLSMPMQKPLEFSAVGALSAGVTHYFQIDVPTNLVGWRLVLSSTGTADPDIYIQRGSVPTTTTYLKASVNRPIDTLFLSNTEATNGTYFVLVTIPFGEAGNATYTLRTELAGVTTLAWDSGNTPNAVNVFNSSNTIGGDYFFKIVTQSAVSGIWRTRLDVQNGEADLYLRQANLPTGTQFDYSSTRPGADGVALIQQGQFQASQTWYVMVTALPGSQWSLYSGNLFIPVLASPAADASGSTNTVIGPEGLNFYKTTISSNTIAWHLGLGGLTNSLYVRKAAVAHSFSSAYYDWKQPGQTLLVPPYLVQNADYYVTVSGTPGDPFTLDSRQQPIVELPFDGSAAAVATDYGYLTFHVNVPAQQIGWQLDLGMLGGDASLAVRLAGVANEYVNTAYVEQTNSSFKTLTLVPPTLTDGSYYVTVYGTPPFSAGLTNTRPVITDVPYSFVAANDQPQRIGWRFYRVTDISQQLSSLGWDLLLSGQVPNTEITLRRNALPGRWSSRTNFLQGTASTVTTKADLSSLKGFLQAPRHAADIWYIGIDQTNQPLGPFVLTSQESSRPAISLDPTFATNSVSGQPAGLVRYFQLTVPTNALGIELKLNNVTSGDPRIVLCRDILPVDLSTFLVNSNAWSPNTATSWPSGAQAAYATDWTGYTSDSRGTNETGHFFVASAGNPLEPGTYYAGIINGGGSTNAMSFDLLSRGLFAGTSFNDLATGGSFSKTGLAPHEIVWHTVVVPSNSPSWKLRLNADVGEGLMVVRQGGLPNYGAGLIAPTNLAGARLQKLGDEHFLMLPYPPSSNIVAGTYYVGVVSEGVNPLAPRSGSNTFNFTMKSEGPIVSLNLGSLDPLGQVRLTSDQAQDAGETHAFNFNVVSNTQVFEVRLLNRTGYPRMTMRADAQFPTLSDSYGYSGGWAPAWADDKLVRIPTPTAGLYTLLVQAAGVSGRYSNSTYRVEVAAQVPQPLGFDNGTVTVTNQPVDGWAYYAVTVPPGVLGWDVRLTGVTSGDPRLVVCRDLIPFNLSTRAANGNPWNPFAGTNWPSGWQIAPAADWTGYATSSQGTNETGRFLATSMGNPLEPGTYIIGVASGGSPGTATVLSYQLTSRGIGPSMSIPVVPLAFAGGQTNNIALAPHDTAYYSVQIPTNMPSWQVRLALTHGDGMLAIRKDGLPNYGAASTTPVMNLAGCKMQKTGNEHFALLATPNATDIPAGTYYLAVVSEGVSPSPATGRIGSGTSDYTLQSIGTIPVQDAGTIDISTAYQRIVTQEGGSVQAYQFQVTPGTIGVVVRLDNRTSNPAMTVRASPILPRSLDPYGRQGGWTEDWSSPTRVQLHTFAGGTYTVLIQAESVTGQYPDAQYTLRILPLEAYITSLDFDGGKTNVAGQLAGEWQYFSVDVPANALGWDLRLTNIMSGSPRLVVCRADWPVDLTSRLVDGTAWNWGAATNWPVSAQAAPALDWTGYRYTTNGFDTTGTIFAAGIGSPLEPGRYIVGVSSPAGSASSMSYTIVSRGIGSGFTIPVVALPTGSASAPVTIPEAREAAYYSIVVPSNAPLWKLNLTASNGEGLLIAHQGALPNVTAATNTLAFSPGGGQKFQRIGSENALLGPGLGGSFVPPGNYYVAVVNEGRAPQLAGAGTNGAGSVDFTLNSTMPSELIDLGPVGASDLIFSDILGAGETAAYQFTLPAGALGLSVSLQNVVGNPFIRMRSDAKPALDPSVYGQGDAYKGMWENTNHISLSSPTSGVYIVTVLAAGAGTNWPPLQFDLRVHADLSLKVLSFDGGSANVNSQLDLWQIFQVTVPPSAVGWDLRLANVSGGAPRMVICRDLAPSSLIGHPELYRMTNWPSGWQLAPDIDWTGLNEADGSSSTGHVFQAGLGNPLEPGTYYVGITNLNSTSPASYTITSRGIGAGFLVKVTDLAFSVTSLAGVLPPRETAWYRVNVPDGVQSWKLGLGFSSGDGLLLAQRGWLPNPAAFATNTMLLPLGGKKMQKPGNEQLLFLSAGASTNLPSGTYYLGIVSEGSAATNVGGRIGTSPSSYSITSVGAAPTLDLGIVGAKDLLAQTSLQGGECSTYRFTVPSGILAVEASFEQTNGLPVMTLAPGSGPPAAPLRYGAEGGAPIQVQSTNVITLANPPATNFSITVQAVAAGIYYSNADFNLRIRSLPILDLNFDSQLNTNGLSDFDVAVLPDGHKAFYRVQVPQTLAGQPVIGWKLSLSTLYGSAQMRVRKDALPDDTGTGTSAYFARQGVFVPDYLAPGTWYVEIKVTGLTDYTLTSAALELERPAWQMPAAGAPVTTPGLPATGPLFGDTGVDTNGVALPNDQGTDLETDSFHYYGVIVPAGNSGLLRTEVDAISGNANLYLRAFAPPTLSHNASGAGGPLYDRAATNNIGTKYGNWVPLDGKSQLSLSPGTWYIAVHAAWGSNIRYRLKLSTGTVSDLTFAGGTLTGQALAAGDWRYFRVPVPTIAPYHWTISFSEQQGDVSLYLRDTIPPGQGTFDNDYVDWSRDSKNHGPYLSYTNGGTYTLSVPPVRPGATYYLGVRAVRDSSVSISSSPANDLLILDGILAFKDGYVTNQIPPGAVETYRIDVPPDARRWSHSAVHDAKVRMFLDQGSLPTLTTADHWYSVGANSTNNKALYNSSWPWLPGYMYYLSVTNTGTSTLGFSIQMDGKDCATDDFNNDGLPDCWEIAYFGSIYTYGPNSDPDGDGLSNLQEFQLGTDPTVPNTGTMVNTMVLPVYNADGTFGFSALGVLNQQYRVQSSSSLQPGSWTDVTNFIQLAPIQPVIVPKDNSTPTRYYRMVYP